MSERPLPSLELRDPRALRAVAHPLRLQLIGLLRTEGPLTASQAGKLLGESAQSCWFHLRQLEKYGIVEEAGGGRGRERPWLAAQAEQPSQWQEASMFGDSLLFVTPEELSELKR